MARPSYRPLLLIAAGLTLASAPAVAQFGSIFREEPPRPPADVPSGPNNYPQRGYPQAYPDQDYPDRRYQREAYPQDYPPQGYPQQAYPQQGYPQQGYPQQRQAYPNRDGRAYPPVQPPYPSNMQRAPVDAARQQGGRGGIEAQPLPPPPGGNAAPERAATPPSQQQQQQQPAAAQQTAPNGTPAQGQPSGTAQPSTEPGLMTKDVVVEPPPDPVANPTAVFAGLDKITGRIISFDVAMNETVQFGALQVTPRVCYDRAPTETPRTDAFVRVDEITLKGEVKPIFMGWMFAASPALHAVEHPIYDVWLSACKGAKQTVAESETKEKAEPAAAKPLPPRRATRRR